ncbi:hypothetical protein HKX48_002947, partial [Thoreauomyces humboldtii]
MSAIQQELPSRQLDMLKIKTEGMDLQRSRSYGASRRQPNHPHPPPRLQYEQPLSGHEQQHHMYGDHTRHPRDVDLHHHHQQAFAPSRQVSMPNLTRRNTAPAGLGLGPFDEYGCQYSQEMHPYTSYDDRSHRHPSPQVHPNAVNYLPIEFQQQPSPSPQIMHYPHEPYLGSSMDCDQQTSPYAVAMQLPNGACYAPTGYRRPMRTQVTANRDPRRYHRPALHMSPLPTAAAFDFMVGSNDNPNPNPRMFAPFPDLFSPMDAISNPMDFLLDDAGELLNEVFPSHHGSQFDGMTTVTVSVPASGNSTPAATPPRYDVTPNDMLMYADSPNPLTRDETGSGSAAWLEGGWASLEGAVDAFALSINDHQPVGPGLVNVDVDVSVDDQVKANTKTNATVSVNPQ